VLAVGDGFNAFADSYLSEASPSFATSALTSVDAINAKLHLYTKSATVISNIPGTIEVFNLQGASMLKATIQNELNTGLKSGMYLVRLTTADNRAVTTKIIIK